MAKLLKKSEVSLIPVTAGGNMFVQSGCVWLTRLKDNRDYILKRAEHCVVHKDESIVTRR